MIPAILSCVFVIYLYQELNRKESPAGTPPVGDGDDAAALTARIAALEERVARLARDGQPEEKKP